MKKNALIPLECIEHAIYLIRGHKVMLDRDLAALYGVSAKTLKQAVRRNLKRFPDDFMFVLDHKEFENWRSQFVTSNSDRMGLRYAPMAFTEQGVAMLSGILNSDRAIEVNIAITCPPELWRRQLLTFVKLRRMLENHETLARKLAEIEKKYDNQFRIVFEVLDELMTPPEPKRKPIGFSVKERRAMYRAGRKKGAET